MALNRGDLFLVRKPNSEDPKRQRAFVVVSRQALLGTRFSTAICAPVYSRRDRIATQVEIGVDEGLKKPSSIHCDDLFSLPKAVLTRYVGHLGPAKMIELNRALAAALGLDDEAPGLESDSSLIQ